MTNETTPEKAQAAVERAEEALSAARRVRNEVVLKEVNSGATKYRMAQRLTVSPEAVTKMIAAAEKAAKEKEGP